MCPYRFASHATLHTSLSCLSCLPSTGPPLNPSLSDNDSSTVPAHEKERLVDRAIWLPQTPTLKVFCTQRMDHSLCFAFPEYLSRSILPIFHVLVSSKGRYSIILYPLWPSLQRMAISDIPVFRRGKFTGGRCSKENDCAKMVLGPSVNSRVQSGPVLATKPSDLHILEAASGYVSPLYGN